MIAQSLTLTLFLWPSAPQADETKAWSSRHFEYAQAESREMADRDETIRDQLAKYGDDGRKPRETMFYFYDGNLDTLETLARAEGFNVTPADPGPGLVLRKTIPVDKDSFTPVVKLMAKWAYETRSDYDGWECKVLRSQ